MQLQSLIEPDGVLADVAGGSKKQLLQKAAQQGAGLCGVPEDDLFTRLVERERLGSTGVGAGVAIPHAKHEGIERMCAVFYRLADPVPFDAVDDQPVDLVFVLFAPERGGAEHLKALAKISRLLRDEAVRDRLRACEDAACLYRALVDERLDAA